MITSKADLRRWGQLVNVIEFTTSIKMCVKGNVMVAQQIKEQKSSYLCATMHRPPTNLPASLAAALDNHKHGHLHALRAVSSAQKQQFGK